MVKLTKFTLYRIIEASDLPLSIIIIGVGNSSFDSMEALDSDDQLLSNRHGLRAKRDIVQFVEFNKYKADLTLLHEEVLREVPDQVVGYMLSKGIHPKALRHLSTKHFR